MADQVPKAVVQERYERLVAVQESISWDGNRALIGHKVEVLINSGDGRKDGATGRMSGRARDGRLVHVAVPPQQAGRPLSDGPKPGDAVTTTVTQAAPHHLVADAPIRHHRRWRGPAAAPVLPQPSRPVALTLTARPA